MMAVVFVMGFVTGGLLGFLLAVFVVAKGADHDQA